MVSKSIADALTKLPPPALDWIPESGQEVNALTSFLRSTGFAEDSVNRLTVESIGILGRCLEPNVTDNGLASRTGLVIGYVQSGKTTSFMTLSALAADNQYPLVIVLAGTQVNLLQQNHGRFTKGLQLERGPLVSPWFVRSNPTGTEHLDGISRQLEKWRSGEVEERKTVLLTVMKHHVHLANLTELMESLADQLAGLPVLVIDDEGDQAGLNTKIRKDGESTTYRNILELRNALPYHSYVMYTATPQAPLLISVLDSLSPDFAVTLEPGEDYTGGLRFFKAKDNHTTVIEVQPSDLLAENQENVDPPRALLDALRYFLLGVAEGKLRIRARRGGPSNRSMMVHPSRLTDDHGTYGRWIRSILTAWREILSGTTVTDDQEILTSEFRKNYAEMKDRVPDLSDFSELLPRIPGAILDTGIVEMNSTSRGEPVDWNSEYSHILVGGQVLDRGFTVEGLTVTYMPRELGVGNADTVQQRARFFGYKASYFGFCRVYLSGSVRDAFESYVDHEESLRQEIKRFLSEGQSLKEWRRQLLLSPALSPTRSSVYKGKLSRGNYEGGVWWPRYPHVHSGALESNRILMNSLVSLINEQNLWESYKPAGAGGIHQECSVMLLREFFEEVLLRYEVRALEDNEDDAAGSSNPDSIGFTGLLAQLAWILDQNPEQPVQILLMDEGRTRKRGLYNGRGKIKSLLSGRDGGRPGDADLGDAKLVRVQIHTLRLEEDGTSFVVENVPVLAVFLPERGAPAWVSKPSRD